jgi:hypothetical protein
MVPTSGTIYGQGVPAPPMGLLLGLEGVEAEGGPRGPGGGTGRVSLQQCGRRSRGLAATLVDAAVTSAVMTTLPRDTINTTLQPSTYCIRPLMLDGGRITAEGTVIHRGRGTATATDMCSDAEVAEKESLLVGNSASAARS